MTECLEIFEELSIFIVHMLNLLSTPVLDNPFIVTPGTVCFVTFFNTVPLSVFYTIYAYNTSIGLISVIALGIWIQVYASFRTI